jgi:hypothetical protein
MGASNKLTAVDEGSNILIVVILKPLHFAGFVYTSNTYIVGGGSVAPNLQIASGILEDNGSIKTSD